MSKHNFFSIYSDKIGHVSSVTGGYFVQQEISLKKIFGGSQILTINATKFAGLDEGATPLGPYSATRGFTW